MITRDDVKASIDAAIQAANTLRKTTVLTPSALGLKGMKKFSFFEQSAIMSALHSRFQMHTFEFTLDSPLKHAGTLRNGAVHLWARKAADGTTEYIISASSSPP